LVHKGGIEKEKIESIKNSINQAREAIRAKKNQEADHHLQDALQGMDDLLDER
jgi:hypothetical protein